MRATVTFRISWHGLVHYSSNPSIAETRSEAQGESIKLKTPRPSNVQCFAIPTAVTFDDSTFLLGPNGSGKTTVLQALSRMFALDPGLRRIQKSDFHVDVDEKTASEELWVEADFEFPELKSKTKHSTVPSQF